MPRQDRRRGHDRRQQSVLGVARGWLVLLGMSGTGAGAGYLGIEHGKQAVEAGISQREADKLIEARNRYEALMYDCLNRRIEDSRK